LQAERGKEPWRGESPSPDSGPLNAAEFGKTLADLSRQTAASTGGEFEFNKRGQLFIRPHNEPIAVAVSINNEDVSCL
jgi:hypothetical protein